MIFLITKIFVYLLLAGGVGAAAGWLFRNLQAQRNEENALRAAHDAKSKLPQLESLLRGRDEQLTKLKEIVAEKQAELGEQAKTLRELEQNLRKQEGETRRWQRSAEAREVLTTDDFEGVENQGDANNLTSELSAEIARLKGELEQSKKSAGILRQSAPQDNGAAQVELELDKLRTQISALERELSVASADLVSEQHKVTELERERELQNKSLQVLHQQLELERTRRVANG